MTDDTDAIRASLREADLLGPGEVASIAPLGGGVSCDVWRVEVPGRVPLAVKRALPRLRVAAEWLAPIERIDAEVRWLRYAHGIDPALVPAVVAYWPERFTMAMRFLPDRPVWKDELAAGRIDPALAGQVGTAVARIHAASAGDPQVARAFANEDMFEALRIAPFLRHVADRDAALAPVLRTLADDLATRRIALVHGDVSPKNILVGTDGPVLLDAECAVYGDPAFDLAFCTAHLLLKQRWLPQHAPALCDAAAALIAAYRRGVVWEPVDGLLARAGTLTAALLLARVEGKSPVAYLDAPCRARVGTQARRLLAGPARPIDQLAIDWFLEETTR